VKLNLDPCHRMSGELLTVIARVVTSEWYIRGPEFDAFNAEFAASIDPRAHAVGVGSGTDALYLILRAAGIGPGDEVISPAMNVAYTALAIANVGATPIFADVDPATLTLDPSAAAAAITPRTKALIPVHLYGYMADMRALAEIAQRHALLLIEDACQAHGATLDSRAAGAWGDAAAFSFYPTKNLGAFGDGGAVVSRDAALIERISQLADGGRSDRYEHAEVGINSSLDELQAAVLRVKLSYLSDSTTTRRALASRYTEAFEGSPLQLPAELPGYRHVYHLYAARSQQRDDLRMRLAEHDIPTLIHYPIPVHLQPCFASLGGRVGQHPVAERAAQTLLSLPLHPELTYDDQQRVITTTLAEVAASAH